jgi:hypothetical protein
MKLYPKLFEELNKRDVKYVVVGGLAVVLHGHPRLTMDADLVVALDSNNARSAIEGLLSLGFTARIPVDPVTFALPEVRRAWIENKNMLVFSMADPKNPFFAVDLFVDPPIPYEELAPSAEWKEVDGVQVHVCSLADLLRMKRLSGRPEDLSDIKALEDRGD